MLICLFSERILPEFEYRVEKDWDITISMRYSHKTAEIVSLAHPDYTFRISRRHAGRANMVF